MQVTNHMDCRMNQRGINKQMVAGQVQRRDNSRRCGRLSDYDIQHGQFRTSGVKKIRG